MEHFAVRPLALVAVIVVDPTLMAVTVPLPFTVAIAVSADSYVTGE